MGFERFPSLRPLAALARLTGVVALAAAVAGCGIRVGSPPAPIPSPDAAEIWRQDLAVTVATVVQVAGAARGEQEEVFAELARVSQGYLEDIGGVWLPPPRDDHPDPASPVEPVGELSAAAALTIVNQQADALLAGADEGGSGPGAAALASIWLTWHAAAVRVSAGLGEPCPPPCGQGPAPENLLESDPGPGVGELTALAAQHAGELIAIYDALGYVEEIRAARAGADRDEIAAGARQLRRLGELLAGEDTGSPADPRRGAYEVDLSDLEATSRHLNASALEYWLSVLPEASPQAQRAGLEPIWHAFRGAHPDLDLLPWPGLAP